MKKVLAQNVLKLRKSLYREDGRSWSRADLAEKTGLTLGTIQKIESAQTWPDWKTLEKISRAFEVSPEELLKVPQRPSLEEALTIVNEKLNIDLRPSSHSKTNFNKKFFLETLEDELRAVEISSKNSSLESMEELISRVQRMVSNF